MFAQIKECALFGYRKTGVVFDGMAQNGMDDRPIGGVLYSYVGDLGASGDALANVQRRVEFHSITRQPAARQRDRKGDAGNGR